MAKFEKTVQLKNVVVGGNAYQKFISIEAAGAGELKEQIQKACWIEEAGVEICAGSMASMEDIAPVLAECAALLAEKAVILNLNTCGFDFESTADDKLRTAEQCAAYVDVIGADEFAENSFLNALKEVTARTNKKLLLSHVCLEGTKSKEDIISAAKAAETKGADLVYLAYSVKDDPDVITLGYAAKEMHESDLVSIPFCVYPLGEVGLITRVLSEHCGNSFGFYKLVEPEGGMFESYDQHKRLYSIYNSYEKLQSKVQYNIDGHVMGGERFLRCMMIKQRTKDDILTAARDVARYNPEMVEWRIDYCVPMGSGAFIEKYWIETLKEIKEILPGVPVVLTFRVKKEGGCKWYPDAIRLKLTKALINTGLIAYADCEIDNSPEYIKAMQDVCKANGTKLVISQHKWTETPGNQEIIDTFKECLDKGADLPKFYLTATNYEDAVRTSEVSKQMRETFLDVPCIICAMGDTGLITRTLGGVIGADFEFIDVTGIRGGDEEDIHYVDQLKEIFGY